METTLSTTRTALQQAQSLTPERAKWLAPLLAASTELTQTSPTSPTNPLSLDPALTQRIARRWAAITPNLAITAPQVSGLRKQAPDGLSQAVGNLFIFTATQLNVVRNLTPVQVALLTTDVLTRYWYWKLDEFIYVCREGIAGRWGKAYDRLDGPTIQEWCAAYETTERAYLLETQAHNEHIARKEGARGTEQPVTVLYVRMKCTEYHESELLGVQRWIAHQWPAKPELAEAVNDYDQELCRQERVAARRLEEQRQKARGLLAEFEASTSPNSEVQAQAVAHYAQQRGIPSLPKPEMKIVSDENAA